MPARVLRFVPLGIVLAVGTLGHDQGNVAHALPGQDGDELPQIEFEHGQRIDSAVCGRCHGDIYDSWKDSVHAESFVDPVFQQGLAQAIVLEGPAIGQLCLSCHSPASVSLDMQRPDQAMEGVNCQFCHALRGADMSKFPPFDLERDLVMHGPLGTSESTAHGVARSEFMATAEYCAACHEFTGPAGATVLSTFTEYEAGAYPELAECQSCHMPLVPGLIVDASVATTSRDPWIHGHKIPGGRDIDQLRRAVRAEVLSIDRNGSSATVEVSIENRAAGHWLPTGMPSRRMVLEVATHWDQYIEARSVVFGRRVVDANNELLRSLPAMILRGARVVNDTRLRPMQERTFNFTLAAPIGYKTELVLRVYYASTELPSLPPVDEDIIRITQPVK